jgi:tetratricopeptide (TPR) repeat protein
MSEILSFPNEAERLWAYGNKKFEHQEFLAAKQLFEQLYQLEPTFQHCQKLVETLQHLGEFTQALDQAEDYLENFLNNPSSFEMYLRLLMLDGQYLAVHSWLHQTVLSFDELKQDLQKLEFAQELIGANDRVLKRRQLQEWESTGYPVPQKPWNEWLKNSSAADFLRLCQEFLPTAKNPFIIPKLVEELVKIGADGEVMICGQIVHLSELTLLEKTPTLQQVHKLLKQKQLKDVQLEEMIIAEIHAHFALLYPFLPNESEVLAWVDSYLLEYKSLFGDESAGEQLQNYERIQQKKQELREIYQKLL